MLIPVSHCGGLLAVVSCLVLCPVTAAGDTVRRYGTGTPGSGDIAPTIWVNSVPRPGDVNFRLRFERTLGGTWALPFMSARESDLSFAGIRFMIDLSAATYLGAYFVSGQGNGGGSGSAPLPLPNNIGLVGRPIFVQAFVLDDFANNALGIAATTGLRLVPALPAEILVARSLPGSPDPQSLIQLGPNRVLPYDQTQFIEGRDVTFVQDGAVALALDSSAQRLRVFDTDGPTPEARLNITLTPEGAAQRLAISANQDRVYVLHNAASGAQPPLMAYDIRAGATFGQVWPGPTLRLRNVHNACAMVFTADFKAAFVGGRGEPPLTDGSLSRVDVRPTSGAFHQETNRIDFPNQYVTDVVLAPDRATLYVALVARAQPSEVALIDVETFTVIDVDANAAGVQNLGGEVSLPRTRIPDVIEHLAIDPRGEELFASSLGAIARVNVAPQSPFFRRVTTTTDNLPPNEVIGALVVSDAGDFVYTTTTNGVVELETARLWSLRAWALTGATGLAFR